MLEPVQMENGVAPSSSDEGAAFFKTRKAVHDLCSHPTEFVHTEFDNCDFLLVTQIGKAGTWAKVTVDEQLAAVSGRKKLFFDTTILLGPNDCVSDLIAQKFAEAFCTATGRRKSLVIAHGLVDREKENVCAIAEFLTTWTIASDLH